MPTFQSIFDTLLQQTPVTHLEEAELFVKEVEFMCQEFIERTPVFLYKTIPASKRPENFFRCKIRHRKPTSSECITVTEMFSLDQFTRSLDVNVHKDTESCLIIIPDGFNIHHSTIPITESSKAGEYIDLKELSALSYSTSLSELSQSTQHILVSGVPFVYCIRI